MSAPLSVCFFPGSIEFGGKSTHIRIHTRWSTIHGARTRMHEIDRKQHGKLSTTSNKRVWLHECVNKETFRSNFLFSRDFFLILFVSVANVQMHRVLAASFTWWSPRRHTVHRVGRKNSTPCKVIASSTQLLPPTPLPQPDLLTGSELRSVYEYMQVENVSTPPVLQYAVNMIMTSV